MEKIKLSSEEAKSIEIAKSMNIEVVVRRHSLDTESSLWEGDLEPLNGMTLHNILSAIYNGYEVEQTPEEKVREYYNDAEADANSDDYDLKFPGQERVEAIKFVLDTLNIKIEGVNA